jgi:hypothetical protein
MFTHLYESTGQTKRYPGAEWTPIELRVRPLNLLYNVRESPFFDLCFVLLAIKPKPPDLPSRTPFGFHGSPGRDL